METKKKFKEYLTKGVRKIKHRKGYGVHSPFAYAIITEVIEEKVPYYAYTTLRKHYTNATPIQFKMACLLLRVANRFGCRRFLEIQSDGGYSALPLLLLDSRGEVHSLADDAAERSVRALINHVDAPRMGSWHRISTFDELPTDYRADFMMLNARPAGWSDEDFFSWILEHSTDNTVFIVKGISAGQRMEQLWDLFCDEDEVSITMDLYNFGLAIRKPRFFKQHYVVSF